MLEIINQKNMNFLIEISKKPRNISELAKRCDLALSAASTLISRWARSNIVNKTEGDGKRGKEIVITLTDYGKSQIKLLKEIKKNYHNNKNGVLSDIELTAVNLTRSPQECCEFSKIEETEKGGENGTEEH